tara:strand:+ start:1031 stop:1243 length:213 start_codon:yes stop_codon:yes gene_type:complete
MSVAVMFEIQSYLREQGFTRWASELDELLKIYQQGWESDLDDDYSDDEGSAEEEEEPRVAIDENGFQRLI